MALTLVAIFYHVPALALEIDRESLKTPEAIGVFVEAISPEAVQDGLLREQIRTAVELRLHKAGIRVDNKFKYGFLSINIKARKNEVGIYALTILAEFIQLDSLIKYPGIMPNAVIWSRGYTAQMEARHLKRYVRDRVGNLVDMFISDYLATKPKK